MWRVIRNLLAVVGLLVALASFAVFVAATISVWQMKVEVNRQTDALAIRAHAAVDAADHAVAFVSDVVTQAEGDLKKARAATPPSQEPVNPFVQLGARKASENLAGSVERANAAVVTASDAVVVAETALKLFGEDEQLKSWFGVKPEQLVQTKTDLGSASRELTNVRTILGIPISDGAPPSAEQLMTVESALTQARSLTNQMNNAVTTTRTRVNETKREVDKWVLRIAVGVTVVGVIAAFGQFFMARFCWRVLRGKPA